MYYKTSERVQGCLSGKCRDRVTWFDLRWSTRARWARVPDVLGTLGMLAKMGTGAILFVLLAFGLAIGAIIALIRLK